VRKPARFLTSKENVKNLLNFSHFKAMKNEVNYGRLRFHFLKLLLIMKIGVFFLFFSALTVTAANTFSQGSDLIVSFRGAPIASILQSIENQSSYKFFYSDNVDVHQKADVDANHAKLEEVLYMLFRGTEITFKKVGNQVALFNVDNDDMASALKLLQGRTVSGVVTDENGEAMPGVTIVVKGEVRGAVTGQDGHYSMSRVQDSDVLIFSFIGMETQEILVGSQSTINVVMNTSAIGIEEVIAVGYAYMKKSDLTGSVSSVRAEELNQTMSSSIEHALVGRASGVQITQSEGTPGAGVKMRIRGITSINADNEPLYIIDGFPVAAGTNSVSSGFSGISGTSVLATLNPNDIESIEVLKDASATAIYGSRGANGVVLITTKSGKKGQQQLSFNAYYGISQPSKKLDLLEGDDYIDYFYDVIGGAFSGAQKSDYAVRDETGAPVVDYINSRGNYVYEVAPASEFIEHDWQDEIFRNAAVQDYNLSFSGSGGNTTYLASLGYFNQEGIILGSNFDRFSGNFKVINQFSKRFEIGVQVNTGYSLNDGIISATSWGGTGNGVVNNMVFFRPVYGKDVEGRQITDMVDDRDQEITNPIKLATEQENLSKNYYIRPNLNLKYEIIDGLAFNFKLGANLNNVKQESWYPGDFGYGKSIGGGMALLNSGNGFSWLNDILLTYVKEFGNHSINAVAGVSHESQSYESFSLAKSGFEIQSINVDNIGSGTEFQANQTQSYYAQSNLRSVLGRLNYTYANRYLFTLTGRMDGSSRFAEGNKYAFFPSAAVAWRISQEPFFEGVNSINDLKLHLSYGVSGNQGIDSYASLSEYSFVEYSYNLQLVKGLRPTRLQNNSLTWETTSQWDVGMDFSMFESRIYLNVAYYSKLTDNLLMQASVPYTTGFSQAWKNTGSIENTGLEIALNTVNVETPNFTWRSNFNISFNQNMVKALNSDLDFFYVTGPGPSFMGDCYVVQVGQPIGSMFGLEFDGVYQIDEFNYAEGFSDLELRNMHPALGGYDLKEEGVGIAGERVLPGMMKFRDIAGAPDENGNPTGPDGVVDANDRTIIGDANPKHYGGFANNFTYKNFSFQVLFNWSYGNDVLNKNLAENTTFHTPYHNQLDIANDRWTAEEPSEDLWGISGGFQNNSSVYVEDGSFLRLSNVTFGYVLPSRIAGRIGASRVRIFVSGDNLHVWTNYSGYDPEVSVGFASTNSSYGLTPGIDFGAYPRSRTFRVGVNLDF
jgi:TonB-dependent starch-binding outer membrane protein SusC